MKVIVIDNYDSFTYNLVHLIEDVLGESPTVRFNDDISIEEINDFDKIILSPGPGLPQDAGIIMEAIKKYAQTKSILGVCLGHQAISEVFGGHLIHLDKVFHGVATPTMILDKHGILKDIPNHFLVGRYHSWAVSSENFPEELQISSTDENGTIMSIRHSTLDVHGVQFHPESYLSEYGHQLLNNFLFPST